MVIKEEGDRIQIRTLDSKKLKILLTAEDPISCLRSIVLVAFNDPPVVLDDH